MLDNKYLYDECEEISEEDFEEAKKIGLKILDFAHKNQYLCLSANQVGYNKRIVVIQDNKGYDIYFNPYLNEIPIDLNSNNISGLSQEMTIDLVSLPKNKLSANIYDTIQIDAFSVLEDDRINFTAEGVLATLWQVAVNVLDGVDKDKLLPCDYLTVKNVNKKNRNDICNNCGKKNKKCICFGKTISERFFPI